MTDIQIETARLRLRPLQAADVAPLAELWADPQVTRYMGGPRDPAQVRQTLEEDLASGNVETFDLWPVIEKATGQVVGHCGLLEKEVAGRDEIELVYVLHPSVWGQGYATEIAGALRDDALDRLGLTRLISLIDPENTASERVARKVGLRLERETVRPGGKRMRVYVVEAEGVRIVDLGLKEEAAIEQAAHLLVEGFKVHWPDAWPDMAAARQEVRASLGPDRISRVAVDGEGQVLGWIGAIREYDGHAWELHPLVVHPEHQRQGIGRRLVADLERQVAAQGAITLYLGTDDEDHMTSLSGVDLYPDVAAHIAAIENRRGHPYEFYQKLGFVIVGVIPDANGPGKPDILMAKRIR